MSYEECWLWKRAFVESREDATEREQQYFMERYFSMRERVEKLVSRIGSDMEEMTVHDISHLDALWEMGSIVAKESVELNPPEAFVFGGAVLLHDAAMTLAAYPKGIEELKGEVTWKDTFARLTMEASDRGAEVDDPMLEKLATSEALRKLHAAKSEVLPTLAWCISGSDAQYIIEDSEIRQFYGPKIGQIAHSHWWSVDRVEEELQNDLGPLGGRTGNRIDVVKIACLLRISDAIHLDRRRAPSFLRALLNPKGVSAQHWAFQERMAVPLIENNAVKYSAAPAFSLVFAEAWWLAFDAVTLVDKELREVDRLLQKRGTGRLNANRVEGVASPSELSRYIETDGWEPVDSTVRVSDVPKIVSTLGGKRLYGDNPIFAIRELIQNAADAVIARRALQKRESDWGEILVRMEERDSKIWLVVEDTGVGMSPRILTGPLIDFGNSFWRSPLAAEEFPGMQATGMSATGRYGIGFFSVFMLGSLVRVTSRRYDMASDSARTLEFQNGLGSRPILFLPCRDTVPLDGGTVIEVRLDQDPRVPGGFLYERASGKGPRRLEHLVASIAPNLNVKLNVVEGGVSAIVVNAEDWLDLNETMLLARLAGSEVDEKKSSSGRESRLRLLKDADGRVLGRAMVETYTWGSSGRGCVSVGGLRSCDVSVIRGVLIGRETTVSRNEALIAAPEDVLAKWASNQATLLYGASLSDEEKARGAEVVLLFGGEIGRLPFAKWKGKWMSSDALREGLAEVEEVAALLGGRIRYDEDLDDVHPREFEHLFEESEDVVFVFGDLPGFRSRTDFDKIRPKSTTSERASNPSDLFRELVDTVWNGCATEDGMRTVGSVGDVEIPRSVTIFQPVESVEP